MRARERNRFVKRKGSFPYVPPIWLV